MDPPCLGKDSNPNWGRRDLDCKSPPRPASPGHHPGMKADSSTLLPLHPEAGAHHTAEVWRTVQPCSCCKPASRWVSAQKDREEFSRGQLEMVVTVPSSSLWTHSIVDFNVIYRPSYHSSRVWSLAKRIILALLYLWMTDTLGKLFSFINDLCLAIYSNNSLSLKMNVL